VPMASLQGLRSALAVRDPIDDPELHELVASIELRAAVELAKLGVEGLE
jgi:Class II flagellar assembly regulator